MFRKYPSLFLLLFVSAGIIGADWWHPSARMLFMSLIIGALTGFIVQTRRLKVIAVLIFGLSLGVFAAFHYSIKYYDFGHDHLLNIISEKETYHLFGRVSDWPDLKPERTEIKIRLDSIVSDQPYKVTGSILLKVTDTTTALQRGDYVTFTGRIYPVNSEKRLDGYDYHHYLNMKGIFGIVYLPTVLDIRFIRRFPVGFFQLTDQLRQAIKNSFQKNLSPMAAALAGGFLIGETRDIPEDIFQMFRDSGTFHLLAVSGSNVALVLIFFLLLLRPLNLHQHKRALVLLLVIIVFCFLSYGEPSVIRASVMAALVIIARIFQRRYDLNNIIALAALIILLVEPAQLFDVGFQLSFITAWGLIYITPRLSDLFKAQHSKIWYRWLVFPVMISLIAQVCSAPVIIYYFDRIQTISVLANLIVVPLVSLGVLGILTLLMADLIFPLLGQWVGSMVNILLNLVVEVLKFLGGENIPVINTSGVISGETEIILIMAFFLLLILTVKALSAKSYRRTVIISFLIVLNTILLYQISFGFSTDNIKIYLNNIPGGVAGIIRNDHKTGADLIITDIQNRDYPIDDKILSPLLTKAGVDKLDRVFILTGAFGALDDVMRLAVSFKAEEVYAGAVLKASLKDVVTSIDYVRPDSLILNYFGGDRKEMKSNGFYPEAASIWVVFDSHKICFTNKLTRASTVPPIDGRENIIVIGHKWSSSVSDWIELNQAGYRQILCSKIEQTRLAESDYSDIYENQVLPEYISDLHQQGGVSLFWPSR